MTFEIQTILPLTCGQETAPPAEVLQAVAEALNDQSLVAQAEACAARMFDLLGLAGARHFVEFSILVAQAQGESPSDVLDRCQASIDCMVGVGELERERSDRRLAALEQGAGND